MAKIVKFLLYKLYFNKKKSPYISSSCFTPPHSKPHWIQFTQHPMSLLYTTPMLFTLVSLCPPISKKILSKFQNLLKVCHDSHFP